MARSGKPSWLKALVRSWFPVKHARQRRRSVRLRLEALEDRITPNAYMVTTTGDGTSSVAGGDGSQTNPYQYATLLGAVNAADADGGTDTITFASSLTSSGPATITVSTVGNTTAGPSDFGVTGSLTINGPTGSNGITLQNSGRQRLFYVGASGNLTLNNLTITGGEAQGGNGGGASSSGDGGGAAGLGGAVLVNGGSFTAQGCTFTNNAAQGGQGGSSGNGFGGGGGGLGGAGGNANFVNGGMGGGPNGGSAGVYQVKHGGAGGFGGGGGGGSGGGGNRGTAGGMGGFGGGGAGYGPGYGGAGGGGFGGGGGGAGGYNYAGGGGFGGGGGGGANGTHGGGGGGGAGLGGAINSNGGTLILTNDSFTTNSAAGGSGGSGAAHSGTAGNGYGGAIFAVNGSVTASSLTFTGNTAAQGGIDFSSSPTKTIRASRATAPSRPRCPPTCWARPTPLSPIRGAAAPPS